MLRRTRFLRPSTATTPAASSTTKTQKPRFAFITRTRVASAMAILSAPVGYYYTQVHLPRARQIRALLHQKRPERTTPVFTTGNEPISSLTDLILKQGGDTSVLGKVIFYFNAVFRR